MDARLSLEWEQHGLESLGSNPPISHYRCKLGTDDHGVTWICEARYRYQEKKYLVAFDYETEEQSAFLKREVIDAPIYWKAHQEVYHSKFVAYDEIQKVIRQFIIDHHIYHKDVAGQLVK